MFIIRRQVEDGEWTGDQECRWPYSSIYAEKNIDKFRQNQGWRKVSTLPPWSRPSRMTKLGTRGNGRRDVIYDLEGKIIHEWDGIRFVPPITYEIKWNYAEIQTLVYQLNFHLFKLKSSLKSSEEEAEFKKLKKLKNLMKQLLLDLQYLVGSTTPPTSLQDRISKYGTKYSSLIPNNSISQLSTQNQLILLILDCLKRINIQMTDYKTESPFGIKDEKAISLALGVVCALGILPNLSFQLLQPNASLKLGFPKDSLESVTNQRPVLEILNVICMEFIQILRTSNPIYTCPSDFIVRNHLVTLYAALMHLSDTEYEYVSIMESLLDKEIPKKSSYSALLYLYGKKQLPESIRKKCGIYLSRNLLLSRNGVSSLLALFLLKTCHTNQPMDPSIVSKLTQIITTVPKLMDSREYFSNIGLQLCQLLCDTAEIPMASLAASITVHILESNPTFGVKYILEPLTLPLKALFSKRTVEENQINTQECDLDGNTLFTTEKEMDKCIHGLYILLLQLKLYPSVLELLTIEIKGLYYLYQSILKSACGLESYISDMLILFFDNIDHSKALHSLKSLVLEPINKSFLNIVLGSNGGICLSLLNKECQYLELNSSVFMEFLGNLTQNNVIADLFLELLQINFNLQETESRTRSVEPKERYIHLCIIMGIMQTYGAQVFENPKQVISFIKNIISSGDWEVIPLAVSLLAALFETDEYNIQGSCYSELVEIHVQLHELSSQHPDEELNDLCLQMASLLNSFDSKETNQTDSSKKFSEAIKSLADPLLPIRAQGLGNLRNLILSKDAYAKDRLEWITTIFLEQLDDEDSYIYLFAIKGLSALTDVYPQESLSVILERFTDKNNNFSMDYRLRMGEVILQTIQRMDQIFPKYANHILDAICLVLKDPQKELRSSAMSGLSIISQVSPLSLLSYIHQIMDYFYHVLVFEKCVETRRGVIYNLCSLLKGLDNRLIHVLEREILEKIQLQVQHTYDTDTDVLTRSHSETALDLLQSIWYEKALNNK